MLPSYSSDIIAEGAHHNVELAFEFFLRFCFGIWFGCVCDFRMVLHRISLCVVAAAIIMLLLLLFVIYVVVFAIFMLL